MTTIGIPRVSTTPGLGWCNGNNEYEERSMGDHLFRKVGDQWYLRVGFANWAKTSEPIRGKMIHDGRYPGRIFYGDPATYELTWTEYEEVGNIKDTFWVVLMDKETQAYEFSADLRAQFKMALDKRAFVEHTLFLSFRSSRVGYDHSRDNPRDTFYV